jgi:hypothetical protein
MPLVFVLDKIDVTRKSKAGEATLIVSPEMEHRWVGRVFSGNEFRLVRQIVGDSKCISLVDSTASPCPSAGRVRTSRVAKLLTHSDRTTKARKRSPPQSPQMAAGLPPRAAKSVGYQTQLRMWIAEGSRREVKRA